MPAGLTRFPEHAFQDYKIIGITQVKEWLSVRFWTICRREELRTNPEFPANKEVSAFKVPGIVRGQWRNGLPTAGEPARAHPAMRYFSSIILWTLV